MLAAPHRENLAVVDARANFRCAYVLDVAHRCKAVCETRDFSGSKQFRMGQHEIADRNLNDAGVSSDLGPWRTSLHENIFERFLRIRSGRYLEDLVALAIFNAHLFAVSKGSLLREVVDVGLEVRNT